jgi:hypothetical protein
MANMSDQKKKLWEQFKASFVDAQDFNKAMELIGIDPAKPGSDSTAVSVFLCGSSSPT